MQSILWDMMRADQFLTDFVLYKDSGIDKRTESINLYWQVFSIHQVTKEQFAESFSYYKKHPTLFKIIMDSLSQSKAEAPTEMIKQPVLLDSFQQLPRKMPQADTIKNLRKKKILPLIKKV